MAYYELVVFLDGLYGVVIGAIVAIELELMNVGMAGLEEVGENSGQVLYE